MNGERLAEIAVMMLMVAVATMRIFDQSYEFKFPDYAAVFATAVWVYSVVGVRKWR